MDTVKQSMTQPDQETAGVITNGTSKYDVQGDGSKTDSDTAWMVSTPGLHNEKGINVINDIEQIRSKENIKIGIKRKSKRSQSKDSNNV